jgi:hypothetical protein
MLRLHADHDVSGLHLSHNSIALEFKLVQGQHSYTMQRITLLTVSALILRRNSSIDPDATYLVTITSQEGKPSSQAAQQLQ